MRDFSDDTGAGCLRLAAGRRLTRQAKSARSSQRERASRPAARPGTGARTGDVAERRGGDDAAEDLTLRLVDRDEDDQPRRAGRHDPDERGDVVRVRVAAAASRASPRFRSSRRRGTRARPPRRPCPARRRRPGASRSARAATLGGHTRRRSSFAARRPRTWSTRCGCDPDALVRERGVHRRHLDRRHRDPLADRDVADRRAGPALAAAARSRALAREVDARRLAEAEPVDPGRRAASSRAAGRA